MQDLLASLAASLRSARVPRGLARTILSSFAQEKEEVQRTHIRCKPSVVYRSRGAASAAEQRSIKCFRKHWTHDQLTEYKARLRPGDLVQVCWKLKGDPNTEQASWRGMFLRSGVFYFDEGRYPFPPVDPRVQIQKVGRIPFQLWNTGASAQARYQKQKRISDAFQASARQARGEDLAELPLPEEVLPPRANLLPTLRRKKSDHIRCATQNVRTLTDDFKKVLCASYMSLHSIDVMFIQETREATETIQNLDMRGFQYWSTPASEAGHGGCAIILNTSVFEVFSVSVLIPSRAILIRCLCGTQRLLLLSVYAPQRTDPNQQTFFDSLRTLLQENAWHDSILLLGGDLNCDGSDVFLQLDLCSSADACTRHSWTWQNNSRTARSEIDFIALPRQHRHHFKRLLYLEGLSSDHRMVVTDFKRFRPFQRWSSPRAVGPNSLSVLAFDAEARSTFATLWKSTPPATSCAELSAKLDQVRTSVPKLARPTRKATWLSDRAKMLLSTFTIAREEGRILNTLEEDHIAEATRLVDNFSLELKARPWQAWRFLRHTETNSSAASPKSSITAQALHDYFTSVMHRHPVTGEPPDPTDRPPPQQPFEFEIDFEDGLPPPILDSDFTLEELNEALRTMKNHTASGPDGIPIELFRVKELLPEILAIINGTLDMDQLPESLIQGFLSPLYKGKGCPTVPSNYRPVTLLSQILKVANKMILLRLRTALDPFLLPAQAAYREHRSTLHNVLSLAQLIHRSSKARSHPLYAVFCDFSKCFDSVYRDRLEPLLRAYGVPPRLLAFIMRSMDQQRIAIRFSGGTPTPFTIFPRFGVMQGCTLAPFLFVLVMDAILRTLPVDCGTKISRETRLPSLGYADDVILLSDSGLDAQRLLTVFAASSAYFGFTLNPGSNKTEPMLFGRGPEYPISLGGPPIPYAKQYKYLGCMVSPKEGWQLDFTKRKKQAWFLVHKFRDVWTSAASDNAKRKLFFALVVPVLTYAAPAYPLTRTVRRTLHVTCNSLLRRALNTRILWDDPQHHIHTEQLYGPLPTLPSMLAYQMVTAWGHYARHTPDSPCIEIFNSDLKFPATKSGTRANPRANLESLTQLHIHDLTQLAFDSTTTRGRAAYDKLALNAALDVELDMYRSFILKRRLGGQPPPEEFSSLCNEREANLRLWWKKVHTRSSAKSRRTVT
jgi:hypothetical protein